jgi:DNA-binding transcriptional ArsR family regulator
VFENAALADLVMGRSTVRQSILALLMSDQVTRLHLRAIQRRVGTSPGTASRELARLVAAGLVEREAEGSQVYFRASGTPVAAMMRQLLLSQTDRPQSAPTRIPRTRKPQQAAAPAEAEPPDAVLNPAAAAVPETAPEPWPGATTDGATTDGATTETAAPTEPGPVAGGSDAHLVLAAAPVEPRESAAIAPPDPLALVVAARFTAAVRPLYGERLKGVFLYGPRAAGPAPEDSDVELLVVLDRVDRYGDELERTSAVCAQLSLDLGLVVSRVFVADSPWPNPGPGFVAVIRDDEVAS